MAQRGVGQHVRGLGPLVVGPGSRAASVLGAEHVVPEQPLERGRVADRAALELGDEDGGAVAARLLGRAAHVRDGGGQLAGLAGADGEHAALLAGQAAAGMDGGDGGEGSGVGAQAGQQDRRRRSGPAGSRTRSKPSVAALTSE